jgi:predicted transglutaminase-like cysteine proteinase
VAEQRVAACGRDHSGRRTPIVVVVVTDLGDLVLDNLQDDVVFWTELPYRWIKRSSPGNPHAWHQIDRAEGRVVVAASCQ